MPGNTPFFYTAKVEGQNIEKNMKKVVSEKNNEESLFNPGLPFVLPDLYYAHEVFRKYFGYAYARFLLK